MPTMDIFNADAFSMVTLTDAINRREFLPQYLGNLGIFEVRPIRTEHAMIEKRGNRLVLIQTSERGAPLEEGGPRKRDIRPFRTTRIAKGDTINAAEIQGIRAFGSETEMQSVESEVADRQASLLDDIELTWEHMRLGAVQGKIIDADGSIIVDWFDYWGIPEPTPIDFELDDEDSNLRVKCHDLTRTMGRAAQGSFTPSTRVHALCGDAFYDAFVTHPMVERTYLNQPAAAELREGSAWQSFNFGGITWHNYRGTDDGSELSIDTDDAKFFPVGARGVFQAAFSPSESFEFVNTPGLPLYSMIVRDEQRNMWARPEVYSYPLFICSQPEVLLRGKRA